jgi:hypothetical protein
MFCVPDPNILKLIQIFSFISVVPNESGSGSFPYFSMPRKHLSYNFNMHKNMYGAIFISKCLNNKCVIDIFFEIK